MILMNMFCLHELHFPLVGHFDLANVSILDNDTKDLLQNFPLQICCDGPLFLFQVLPDEC